MTKPRGEANDPDLIIHIHGSDHTAKSKDEYLESMAEWAPENVEWFMLELPAEDEDWSTTDFLKNPSVVLYFIINFLMRNPSKTLPLLIGLTLLALNKFGVLPESIAWSSSGGFNTPTPDFLAASDLAEKKGINWDPVDQSKAGTSRWMKNHWALASWTLVGAAFCPAGYLFKIGVSLDPTLWPIYGLLAIGVWAEVFFILFILFLKDPYIKTTNWRRNEYMLSKTLEIAEENNCSEVAMFVGDAHVEHLCEIVDLTEADLGRVHRHSYD